MTVETPAPAVATRPMRWWDIEPVMVLERELFGSDAWSDAMFWSELAQPDTRWYVVATEGEAVVAYAGLCSYPDEAYVQTIAVSPALQGQGVGATLLRLLLDEAARRGNRVVLLEVRADNEGAQRLYERFGFVRIGVRRGYYQPSGADAVIMRRTA
jgi:ribosomal-protein-alanine N-acetyltransferase